MDLPRLNTTRATFKKITVRCKECGKTIYERHNPKIDPLIFMTPQLKTCPLCDRKLDKIELRNVTIYIDPENGFLRQKPRQIPLPK